MYLQNSVRGHVVQKLVRTNEQTDTTEFITYLPSWLANAVGENCTGCR